MLQNMPKARVLHILGLGIAAIQVFDLIIHAATNQLEPLRVASNLVILVWLAIIASGRFLTISLRVAISSVSAYAVLNGIFLAREGVTNVEQGGELRITLFVLVFLTLTLSILLTYLYQKNP